MDYDIVHSLIGPGESQKTDIFAVIVRQEKYEIFNHIEGLNNTN